MNLEQVHKMGYTNTDLIPTTLRMQAIDTNPIEIIGAIIVRLSGMDIQGTSHETIDSDLLCLQHDRGNVPKRTWVQTARDHTGILLVSRRCRFRQRRRSQFVHATTNNRGHLQFPEAYDTAATVHVRPAPTYRQQPRET